MRRSKIGRPLGTSLLGAALCFGGGLSLVGCGEGPNGGEAPKSESVEKTQDAINNPFGAQEKLRAVKGVRGSAAAQPKDPK